MAKEETCATTTATGDSVGWIRFLQVNDMETNDYLEVRYRTSYSPETGMVIEEVRVRDPKAPERVRNFTPQEWKEIEFPVDLGEQ